MVGKRRRRTELERKPIKGVLFSSTLTTVGNWNSVLLGPSWEAEVQGSWVTDSSARRYTECFLQVRINLPALLPALMARRFPRLKPQGPEVESHPADVVMGNVTGIWWTVRFHPVSQLVSQKFAKVSLTPALQVGNVCNIFCHLLCLLQIY